jgi:hypothetical protein
MHLQALKNLGSVYVNGSDATEAGVSILKEAIRHQPTKGSLWGQSLGKSLGSELE